MPLPVHRLRELRAERARVAEQMSTISTAAGNGELSAEQRANFDALFTRQASLKQDIEREERAVEVERELAGSALAGGAGQRGDGGAGDAEERSGERETQESGGGAAVATAEGDDEYDAIGIRRRRHWRSILARPEYRTLPGNQRDARGRLTTEAQQYREANRRYLRTGESRGLQAGTDTDGGFTVAPVQMAAGILQALDNTVWIRQLATVLTVTNAAKLGMLSLDSDPDDAEWTSELATGSEDNAMKFGRREFEPYPLAKRVKISKKLLRQSGIDIEALVRDRFAYKFGVAEEKAFLVGSGVREPLGLFTPSNDGIPTSRDIAEGNTTTAITYDGLVAAQYSLKGQYRAEASWLFHRDGIKRIALLKDGADLPLWQPAIQLGQPDRLLGRPLMESEYVPNTYTTGKYVGMYAAFRFYTIVDALAMEIQRLVELYAETNQVGFIMRRETDAGPTQSEAFVRLKLG